MADRGIGQFLTLGASRVLSTVLAMLMVGRLLSPRRRVAHS
jgi:hypothetical protein